MQTLDLLAESCFREHLLVKVNNRNTRLCYYHLTSAFQSESVAPVSSKEFLDIQATVECGFTLKRVPDMKITCNQMHCTDKYSQHNSIIWPICLNG